MRLVLPVFPSRPSFLDDEETHALAVPPFNTTAGCAWAAPEDVVEPTMWWQLLSCC